MGCSCGSPQPFLLKVNGKEYVLYGVDQVIFSTILAFHEDNEAAAEQLWDGVKAYNNLAEDQKKDFKAALLAVYQQARSQYNAYLNG